MVSLLRLSPLNSLRHLLATVCSDSMSLTRIALDRSLWMFFLDLSSIAAAMPLRTLPRFAMPPANLAINQLAKCGPRGCALFLVDRSLSVSISSRVPPIAADNPHRHHRSPIVGQYCEGRPVRSVLLLPSRPHLWSAFFVEVLLGWLFSPQGNQQSLGGRNWTRACSSGGR
jgi:hypothetical protein